MYEVSLEMVDTFLTSPSKNNIKTDVRKIMNPTFLLGIAFNTAYKDKKYHSGTICKGVTNPLTSTLLSGCDKLNIPKNS
jgi:hypothetical protein